MESWSHIEVNVRKLVKELMEPTVLRVLDNRSQIENLIKESEAHFSQANDHSMKLSSLNENLQAIDKFSRKLIEFSAAQKSLEHKQEQERINQRELIEKINKQLVKSNENIGVLERQREQMRGDVAETRHSVALIKGFVDDRIHEFAQSQVEKNANLDAHIKSMSEKIDENTRHLAQVSADLSNTDYVARQTQKVSAKNKTAIKAMIKQNRAFKHDIEQVIEYNRMIEANNSITSKQSIDNLWAYSRTDLPIIFSLTTNNLLFEIVDGYNEKKKVAESLLEMLEKYDNSNLPTYLEQMVDQGKRKCMRILGPKKKAIESIEVSQKETEDIGFLMFRVDELTKKLGEVHVNLESFKIESSQDIENAKNISKNDIHNARAEFTTEISRNVGSINSKIKTIQDNIADQLYKISTQNEQLAVHDQRIDECFRNHKNLTQEFREFCDKLSLIHI